MRIVLYIACVLNLAYVLFRFHAESDMIGSIGLFCKQAKTACELEKEIDRSILGIRRMNNYLSYFFVFITPGVLIGWSLFALLHSNSAFGVIVVFWICAMGFVEHILNTQFESALNSAYKVLKLLEEKDDGAAETR